MMNKLQELRAECVELKAQLAAILDMTPKDDEEDKDLLASADEKSAALAKLERRIALAEKIEAISKESAKPVVGANADVDLMVGGVQIRGNTFTTRGNGGGISAKAQAGEELGIGFARYVKCWAASGGQLGTAHELAKAWYPDDKRLDFKATLLQNTGTAGGFLVPEEQSRELIELLRHMAVVRPNARVVPLHGTMVMPVQTGGVAAAYIGENTDDNAQDLTFGQRRLTARKLRALVAVSNDLIRNSSPEADRIVRDDLARGLAEAEDLAFIRSTGVGDNPKGLRYWAPTAAVVNGSGTTAAAIEADLIAMVARLAAAMKGQMQSPRWFMSSRSYFKLYSLRTAAEALVFPEIRNSAPTLLGYPVSKTDQIPITLSPGTVTEIYLVDAAQMIIGEELGITISMSDTAAFKDSTGTLQSAYSLDLSVLRAIAKHDFILRRDEAVQVLTGSNVSW